MRQVKDIETQIESAYRLCRDVSTENYLYAKKMQDTINSNTTKELEYLRVQNSKLTHLLEHEKSNSKIAQDKLKRSFSELMQEFDEKIDTSYNSIELCGRETYNGMVESFECFKESSCANLQLHSNSIEFKEKQIEGINLSTKESCGKVVKVITNIIYF